MIKLFSSTREFEGCSSGWDVYDKVLCKAVVQRLQWPTMKEVPLIVVIVFYKSSATCQQ